MAETKKVKEETIDTTPIEGQIEIEPNDTDVIKVVAETPDTIEAEMSNGDTITIEKSSIVYNPNDLVSKTKVLNAIDTIMTRYNGKVVLAMSEVRDILKAITTAINE